MELGKRIVEFGAGRKISFDGECYHSRIPLELIEILKKEGVSIDNVRWEGVWKEEKALHVILAFLPDEESKRLAPEPVEEKQKSEGESDDDYVVLRG